MKVVKPKRRIIFYWFFDKGFFFIAVSLLLLGTYLRYFTEYFVLTVFVLELVIVATVFSLLLLLYEWFMTEYYLLDDHILLNDAEGRRRVKYSEIENVGYYGSLLQHLMGTTNVQVRTKGGRSHYIRGVRRPAEIEDEILRRSTKP